MRLNNFSSFSTISTQMNKLANLHKIKFQSIGNLHIDKFHKNIFQTLITPKEPNLIVTGNITYVNAHLLKFLDYVSFNFDKVFYVPGIMELSNNDLKNTKYTINELLQTLHIVCNKYQNIHFLHNTCYNWTDHDLQVVGSMYWGKVKDARLFLHSPYYSHMYNSNKALITPGVINSLHQQSYNFLLNLDVNTDKVVISHYPMYAENNYDENSLLFS
jgi:hypothetical protein